MLINKRYRRVREIKKGGQATVWEAVDEQLGRRPVAIKRLHDRLANDRRAVARFEREVKIMARLDHPHILKIYDTFVENGRLHLVLEYSEAGSLRDFVQNQGNLSLEEVVELGKSVAYALKTTHQHGIIHRDIKPENILLSVVDNTYVVKVADFGIAAVPDPHEALTQTDDRLGTPAYWAPEQLRGQAAVPQTDIYALAAVMYRLLAKRHYLPLNGDIVASQQRILEEMPQPLTAVRPDMPVWLNDLIMQALAKEPQKRPSAAEFYERLRYAGQTGEGVVITPQIESVSALAAPPATGWQLALTSMVTAVMVTLILLLAYLHQPVGSSLNEPIPMPAESVTVVVSGTAPADGLRLRQGPSTDETIITVWPDGTTLTLLHLNEAQDWAYVADIDSGQSGWVYAQYLADR